MLPCIDCRRFPLSFGRTAAGCDFPPFLSGLLFRSPTVIDSTRHLPKVKTSFFKSRLTAVDEQCLFSLMYSATLHALRTLPADLVVVGFCLQPSHGCVTDAPPLRAVLRSASFRFPIRFSYFSCAENLDGQEVICLPFSRDFVHLDLGKLRWKSWLVSSS